MYCNLYLFFSYSQNLCLCFFFFIFSLLLSKHLNSYVLIVKIRSLIAVWLQLTWMRKIVYVCVLFIHSNRRVQSNNRTIMHCLFIMYDAAKSGLVLWYYIIYRIGKGLETTQLPLVFPLAVRLHHFAYWAVGTHRGAQTSRMANLEVSALLWTNWPMLIDEPIHLSSQEHTRTPSSTLYLQCVDPHKNQVQVKHNSIHPMKISVSVSRCYLWCVQPHNNGSVLSCK